MIEFHRGFRDVGARSWLEMIAEVGLVLFPFFLRGGLLAMLRIADVVFHTHLADVQFRVARLADIEPPQGQAERRQ